MYRCAVFVSLLAVGIVFQLSHGAEVNIRDKDDKLCLYANLMVNFSVSYEAADNKSATAEFELPADVTTVGSTCDATSSTLKLNFGDGHSWSVNFTLNGKVYQADTVSFSYNLGDKTVFPNSASNDTTTLAVKPGFTDVVMDTCYSCKSRDTLESTLVNQTLWNVLIQAFVSDNSTSANITSCAADTPTTPVAPTTHTTGAPTTAPATNATTTATPTTTPTPTLPPPTTGEYHFKSDDNSTACLMVDFGLRINYKQEEMNFDPNGTVISGSCGVNGSELVVVSNTQQLTIKLTFTNDTKKFRLHALNITGKTSAGVSFSEANTNLSLWEAAVGSSYMCNKEQNYTITNQLTIYTFNLHVQPFGVKKGVFSTAEECFLDSDLSFLVPIAVGVALSFLIILVLISYLIGRRKSRTGYQSV